MSEDDRWSKEPAPPSPLFLGEKERNFAKQINDEVLERVVGQQILYYPLSIEHTNYNQYGEAIVKNFLPPIRVYALVEWGGEETVTETGAGVDKLAKATIKFHRRRLTEDQDLYVTNGDFILYGDTFYELVKVDVPRAIFGQIDYKFEIIANAIQARREIFDST